VRIDPADQDVEPFGSTLVGRLQHGVGFPDARGCAQKDLERAATLPRFFFLDAGQEGIGIGPVLGHIGTHRASPRTPCVAIYHSLLERVQGEVQSQDTHPWLAEQAELATLRGSLDELPDSLLV
jgi:hypothetical protein